jgi:hypothetical protein
MFSVVVLKRRRAERLQKVRFETGSSSSTKLRYTPCACVCVCAVPQGVAVERDSRAESSVAVALQIPPRCRRLPRRYTPVRTCSACTYAARGGSAVSRPPPHDQRQGPDASKPVPDPQKPPEFTQGSPGPSGERPTAMTQLRIVTVGISGGRALTRPFRDAR